MYLADTINVQGLNALVHMLSARSLPKLALHGAICTESRINNNLAEYDFFPPPLVIH